MFSFQLGKLKPKATTGIVQQRAHNGIMLILTAIYKFELDSMPSQPLSAKTKQQYDYYHLLNQL